MNAGELRERLAKLPSDCEVQVRLVTRDPEGSMLFGMPTSQIMPMGPDDRPAQLPGLTTRVELTVFDEHRRVP